MVLGSCTSLQVGAACAARLFPYIGSLSATFLRLLVAAVVLLLATRPRALRWQRGQWGAVVVFGLTLAGMNGSFYESIARIPLGTAVTIEFLGPLTVAAVLSRRLRDLTWVVLAAVGVCLLGLTHGGTSGSLNAGGVAFALLAGAFWAGYILASARVGALVPGQGGLAVAVTVGAVVLLPVGLSGALHVMGSPRLALLAAGTGLLASVIPYSLELSALRRLPARVFGVLLSLEPAIAATAGWLLLNQDQGPWEWVAVAVVVAASAGSTLTAEPRKSEPDPITVVSPVAEASHPVTP
jgi:inner membrane transporter RhtA